MSNLHQLSRGITHRNRMRLWVVLCGKGFSTSLPEEGVTVTEVLMKNYFVFGLLLLSSFIYLTNETKQACEGFYDWFMCGNVCLMFYKTCRCGENNEFNQGNGQICCAPSGNCIKDNQGNLFQISQVTKSFFFFKKKMLNLLRKWFLLPWYNPKWRYWMSWNMSWEWCRVCQTTMSSQIRRNQMLSKNLG